MDLSCKLICVFALLVASSTLAFSEFGYYQLVLMWPGAYCAQSGCCLPKSDIPASDFFIAGFQTYNSDTGRPVTKCRGPSFNNTLLSDELKGELSKYWSNIKCPSNDVKNSWKSAWKTFGVCSHLEQEAYFQAALDVRAKVNALSLLTSKGIMPNYELYSVEEMKSAIAEGVGAAPLIQCSVGPFGKYQLYQIYIRVDKDASTIIECPFAKKFTCSDEILFHPFHDWMLDDTTAGGNPFELPIVANE